ncbi:glycosyltransferase family 4 protein [Pontibacter sp. HSC-14F20]|uniref:glycosyltransferase family 4 protein n=1 Tax=Pontibacter sp. HSC-14F20 TaxID=2864136 RepID=UPI001C73CC81|nr:glycosyltransferase family 4 protein [Pontibacter sp. HSC-14F20]MBX0333445.1 glycosyltransferase family 4 protein [Pontibacter sp. HSC-14F20]
MNVFIIPSWYPSKDYPFTGIMIAEQYEAIAKINSHVNIGISIWGQMDKSLLLHSRDHIKNIPKLIKRHTAFTITKSPNLKEYHTPAFTWSRKFLKGNFKKIVSANLENLKSFENDFGPIDLIHAQVGHPAGNIALDISIRTNLPFCITERMGPFPSPYTTNKEGTLTYFHQLPYLASDINIAVSPFQKKMMEKQKIPQISIIPDFINEDFFEPAEQLHHNNKIFTFFSFARLVNGKGIGDLIVSIKSIVSTGIKLKLRLAGTGPQKEELIKLANELDISHVIDWLGDLTRVEALQEYQKCDSFVLPSYYESFGMVYIEALACGKPIIATRCGGPDTIVNDTNGLLVEKSNPQELANAMIKMIKCHNRYDSHAIRQDFMNRFSKRAVIPQIMDLYKQVIAQHKPTS